MTIVAAVAAGASERVSANNTIERSVAIFFMAQRSCDSVAVSAVVVAAVPSLVVGAGVAGAAEASFSAASTCGPCTHVWIFRPSGAIFMIAYSWNRPWRSIIFEPSGLWT